MKKLILVLFILLVGCSSDDNDYQTTPIKTVEKYNIYIKATPSYSDVYFKIYSNDFDNVIYEKSLNQFISDVYVNYDLIVETGIIHLDFKIEPQTFILNKLLITKYYDDGSSEIVEELLNINYSDSVFQDRYYVNIHGNNSHSKYLTYNFVW